LETAQEESNSDILQKSDLFCIKITANSPRKLKKKKTNKKKNKAEDSK